MTRPDDDMVCTCGPGDACSACPPERLRPPVNIARCPVHGLHGERTACFVCGGPVEQVAMVPAAEVERLRVAMEWYADRDNWIDGRAVASVHGEFAVDDAGHCAWVALNPEEPSGGEGA